MNLGVMKSKAKDIIIEYGDPGNEFFIILNGKVSIQKPINKAFTLEPVPQLNLNCSIKKRVTEVNLSTQKLNFRRKNSIVEKL